MALPVVVSHVAAECLAFDVSDPASPVLIDSECLATADRSMRTLLICHAGTAGFAFWIAPLAA
jgi:hypothetical protein